MTVVLNSCMRGLRCLRSGRWCPRTGLRLVRGEGPCRGSHENVDKARRGLWVSDPVDRMLVMETI